MYKNHKQYKWGAVGIGDRREKKRRTTKLLRFETSSWKSKHKPIPTKPKTILKKGVIQCEN